MSYVVKYIDPDHGGACEKRLGTKGEALTHAFALSTDLLPHVWIEDEAGLVVIEEPCVFRLGVKSAKTIRAPQMSV